MKLSRAFFVFDWCLIVLTTAALVVSFFFRLPEAVVVLATLSFLGLIPVAISAVKSLIGKRLSVDLLASIALGFSLLSAQWSSAAFITLMLAFARVFDYVTSARAKRTIESLMKFHVERVQVKVGDSVREVGIRDVKPGDLVIVDSGDRMPVDGVVESGAADMDESSLTGESELVPKKPGDKVYTATVNEGGSLVVRTEKVGADTTLARMVGLVQEATRAKSPAERMADRFTQWYIFLSLLASAVMYWVGLSPQEILAVLLVVCADDIAVAVPLAFTAAIARAARRGVIVKGSAAFEQLSKVRYILTDKTGTLTRGRPKVVDIRAYGTVSAHTLLRLVMMGSSGSKHAVSRAILEYGSTHDMTAHPPTEIEEVPGQGVRFRHGSDHMLFGRLSFMSHQKVHLTDEVRCDIDTEKDAGRGVAILSLNGEAVGLVSYIDELRPRVKEIIAMTKRYGVQEWHILTGDNEHAAAAVAGQLGLRHYHANMTPESKLAFVKHFEAEYRSKGLVAYIGDGVNDAASLALADVSIAMGGIGADAAIEAADITIMKDRLDRLPEVIGMADKVTHVMWQNFGIWAVTNLFGLAWVAVGIPGLGFLGPAGAAAYNFLTDFLPIGNAFRAGRGKTK